MKKCSLYSSVIALSLALSLGSHVAQADDTDLPKDKQYKLDKLKKLDKQPLEQSTESVEKNREKDPDNAGLQNAHERLEANQERILDKRQLRGDRVDTNSRPMKSERQQKFYRTDKPARGQR